MIGRPTSYTPELAVLICERIVEGDSLRTISKDNAMPAASTVFLWLTVHKDFSEQYAKAKEQQTVALAEEIMDIADDGSNDWMETHHRDNVGWQTNGEAINRSRLRVDTRKWLLTKLAPKKYGEKLTTEHTGPDGSDLKLFTDAQLHAYLASAGC